MACPGSRGSSVALLIFASIEVKDTFSAQKFSQLFPVRARTPFRLTSIVLDQSLHTRQSFSNLDGHYDRLINVQHKETVLQNSGKADPL